MKNKSLFPNARFKGITKHIDWRKIKIKHYDEDNDELLHKTPKDVRKMLGFDPRKEPHKTESSINHDHKQLLKTHNFTGLRYNTMPGLGRMQKIAHERDFPLEHVHAFRTAPNEWGIYIKKGVRHGYVDAPMLPSRKK